MTAKKLTEIEFDALRETANIGAGNASIALSKIVKKTVNLRITNLALLAIDQLKGRIGQPHKLYVGVFTPIRSGLGGSIAIMLEKASALGLADQVIGARKRTGEKLSPRDKDSLRDVGMAITNNYVESLNRFLDLRLRLDEAEIATSLGASAMDVLTANLDPGARDVLLINTDFGIHETDISGSFILLLPVRDADVMLRALDKKIR